MDRPGASELRFCLCRSSNSSMKNPALPQAATATADRAQQDVAHSELHNVKFLLGGSAKRLAEACAELTTPAFFACRSCRGD